MMERRTVISKRTPCSSKLSPIFPLFVNRAARWESTSDFLNHHRRWSVHVWVCDQTQAGQNYISARLVTQTNNLFCCMFTADPLFKINVHIFPINNNCRFLIRNYYASIARDEKLCWPREALTNTKLERSSLKMQSAIIPLLTFLYVYLNNVRCLVSLSLSTVVWRP